MRRHTRVNAKGFIIYKRRCEQFWRGSLARNGTLNTHSADRKMIFGQSQFTGSPNVDSYCQMAIWSLLKLTTPREVRTRFFRTWRDLSRAFCLLLFAWRISPPSEHAIPTLAVAAAPSRFEDL